MSRVGRGCCLVAVGIVWGQGYIVWGSGHRLEAGDIVWGQGESFVSRQCLSFVFIFVFMFWAL